jgi:hypothetical protein
MWHHRSASLEHACDTTFSSEYAQVGRRSVQQYRIESVTEGDAPANVVYAA